MKTVNINEETFDMPHPDEVVDKETGEITRKKVNYLKSMYRKVEDEVMHELHKDIVTCVPNIRDYTVFNRRAGFHTRIASATFMTAMAVSSTSIAATVGTGLFAKACVGIASYVIMDISTSPIRTYTYKKILATDKSNK